MQLTDHSSTRERIHYYRLKQKLTQEELAALAGLSRGEISKAESGRPIAPSSLLRIVEALGISPRLFGDYVVFISDAQNVRRWRLDHGLTQMQFAKLLGVKMTSVQEWESGKRIIAEKYYKILSGFKNEL